MEPDLRNAHQGTAPGANMEQEAKRKPLPSRSEFQRRKRKKKKRKIKFPMLKLLAMFFILMPVAFYTLYMHYGQGSLKSVQEEAPFETVELNGEAEEAGISASGGDSQGNDASQSLETEEENGYKIIHHIVLEQETLASISLKYYNSDEGIPLIKKWNRLDRSEVKAGETLKIPIKK